MSEEEKIKKAEEISARRNNRIPASNINSSPTRKLSLLSKTFIQVICSMCIFGIIYFINQNNSIAIEKIKPILSQDTDFVQIYNQIGSFIQDIKNSLNEIDNEQNTKDANEINQTINETNGVEQNTSEANETENSTNENNNLNDNPNEDSNKNVSTENLENNNENTENDIGSAAENLGVGGGGENLEISETDQDILFIKSNASFIKPVNGVITSGYGEREPTEIISANHAGVDIGANSGTEIIASMAGTVELVSNYGDYGNHIKITNGEITTLYAHCSTILVKQGDYISQGQKIALVGSTGKTTGPHLHFEIRRNNKTVDPQKILDL